jgi:acetyl-CoA acetyltransferase
MEDIVIVSAARTAVGKFGGTLAKTPAPELGAAVIKALLARTGLKADQVGEVNNQVHMGTTAENVNKKYGITREMQDALALGSQQKAAAAQDAGKFKDEIVPLSIA